LEKAFEASVIVIKLLSAYYHGGSLLTVIDGADVVENDDGPWLELAHHVQQA
jgi:hypothetical protein